MLKRIVSPNVNLSLHGPCKLKLTSTQVYTGPALVRNNVNISSHICASTYQNTPFSFMRTLLDFIQPK